MNRNLIKATAKIFGGSAVASLGFSFGRDIYKSNKKKDVLGLLLLILILAVLVIGCYSGALWTLRNYQTKTSRFFNRLGSIIVLSTCFSGMFMLIYSMVSSNGYDTYETHAIVKALILPFIISLAGGAKGFLQRKTRAQIWDSERKNIEFLERSNLIEHENGTLEDLSGGQVYRIEHIGMKRITLFPIGRRGVRGYININDSGQYYSYRGV